MVHLHDIHPRAKQLGWIEHQTAANAGDIGAIGRVIAEITLDRPSVFFLGAGMSKQAGLPTARDYCTTLAHVLLDQPLVQVFLADKPTQHKLWIERLSKLEFDVLLALVRIGDPDRYPSLFEVFRDCQANASYEMILRIAQKIRCPALFTTNFDDAIERTAERIGIAVRPVSEVSDFPKTSLLGNCIPLYKLHGGFDTNGNLCDLQADFVRIGAGLRGPRLQVLQRYLTEHHMIVLGYGGADYWDIYPTMFSPLTQGLFWITHSEFSRGEVMTSSESWELLRIRTQVERLLAFSPGRVQISCPTTEFLKSVGAELGIKPVLAASEYSRSKDWSSPIRAWAEERGAGVLVDFGAALAALGDLHLAHDAFDSALRTWRQNLLPRDLVEALLGRASTSLSPEMYDIDEAISVASGLDDPSCYLRAVVEQGIAVGNQGNRRDAIRILSEGTDRAIYSSLSWEAGLCLANKAHQFCELGEYEAADTTYTDAEQVLRDGGIIPELFITLGNHADMLAMYVSTPSAVKKALNLDIEALSRSWGRELNGLFKRKAYARVLVSLCLLYPNPSDAIDRVVGDTLATRSGFAEHLVHRIVAYGYDTRDLELETWQHEMTPG